MQKQHKQISFFNLLIWPLIILTIYFISKPTLAAKTQPAMTDQESESDASCAANTQLINNPTKFYRFLLSQVNGIPSNKRNSCKRYLSHDDCQLALDIYKDLNRTYHSAFMVTNDFFST